MTVRCSINDTVRAQTWDSVTALDRLICWASRYLSWMIVCFVFRGFPEVISSLFLLWLLVVLGLGGGDVPLLVCVLHLSTMITGERGTDTPLAATDTSAGSLVALLVLTSTTEIWLEESTGSSSPVSLPLDSGVWSLDCFGSDWLGLCLGEGTSDCGDVWDLLSSERGLSPLVGSSSSSFMLCSSPAETLPDTSSAWSSLLVPSAACSASLLSSSLSPSSIKTQNKKTNAMKSFLLICVADLRCLTSAILVTGFYR